jgi:hypothetical protein
MNRRAGSFGVLVVAVASGLLLPAPAVTAQKSGSVPQCRPDGAIVRVAGLSEASGLAASRRVTGRLWSHNDSGDPVLVALDALGAVTGRVTVSGAKVEDWEAIAVGPCPAGSCIYVGDIGDNGAHRQRITIYRIPDADAKSGSTPASEVFHATYPDGPHDAETLLMSKEGRLFVVTKGETGAVALYAFPREMRAGASVRLERVGQPRQGGKTGDADRVTDGSVSGDGQWVVLRSKTALTFYKAADFFAGNWREASSVDVKSLAEPQGEGVAFGADNVLYLAGEGGGKSQPGTFARFTCVPE